MEGILSRNDAASAAVLRLPLTRKKHSFCARGVAASVKTRFGDTSRRIVPRLKWSRLHSENTCCFSGVECRTAARRGAGYLYEAGTATNAGAALTHTRLSNVPRFSSRHLQRSSRPRPVVAERGSRVARNVAKPFRPGGISPGSSYLVRADGIEPTRPAWKAGVLPLNYAREALGAGSLLRRPGQACNFDLRMSRIRCATCFSPGFYPVSRCEAPVCAVVWVLWQSSLRLLPLRFNPLDRRPRKRPLT